MANSKSSQRKKQAEKDYLRKLRKLEQTGIYQPTGHELTEWRKRQINSLTRKYAEALDSEKSIFVKIPKNEQARSKSILKRARAFDLQTTRTGVFVEKVGNRRARFNYNDKTQEFEIKMSGRVKWGKNKGKKITSVIPLARPDALARENERIRDMGASLLPLKKNERLYFKVRQEGREGFSHAVFSTPQALMNYLNSHYEKNSVNRLLFHRHITVEKTTLTDFKQMRRDQAAKRKAGKRRKINKTGRSV